VTLIITAAILFLIGWTRGIYKKEYETRNYSPSGLFLTVEWTSSFSVFVESSGGLYIDLNDAIGLTCTDGRYR
jgi:hypothetical protein